MLQLEEQARLHLYLDRLVSFPFRSFFRYFDHMLGGRRSNPKYPAFEHAPVMLTWTSWKSSTCTSASSSMRARVPVRRRARGVLHLRSRGDETGGGNGRRQDRIGAHGPANDISPSPRRSTHSKRRYPCWTFCATSAATPGSSSYSIPAALPEKRLFLGAEASSRGQSSREGWTRSRRG